MGNLEDYRREIDSIDRELIALFEKRMNVAIKVGEYKKERNLPIFNAKREEEVIEKNINLLNNREYSEITRNFFEKVMELSRSLQADLMERNKDNIKDNIIEGKVKIGYQGVEGSFSEEALRKYFNSYDSIKNYEEFKDVFNALENNYIQYAILPIENSYTGAITEVYDLLVKYNFYIVGEECIKIDQNLMGISGTNIDEIEEIYSHPQGFEQSRGFLSRYDKIKLIPYHNTAISAKLVSDLKDKKKAAIGSKRAANIYGLSILKENINDKKDNHTKFIIIGKELKYNDSSNKISVVFSLEDKAGTLYKLLRHFAENHINMIKIESRPNKHESWKYLLYVDFEGNLNNDLVKNALELIEKNSGYFKIIGNYKNSNN
ncbi:MULTISPECIES: prephenate dehydratase [unclassified Clostridium]|uniref:prephenate dehydratase n=1 Tax=unclassified Clostridium TaxID=2614128 RepID=UPI0025C02223|nr:prephenate dehydratase [Clostridium sp.]MDY4252093.1 prephenate dehydratase [Clostridium sp.]MDY6228345.1 prephenate dehydratase [Clostridium sp.]